MLTYEVIYDILLREKQREDLQKVDDRFWLDTLAYLREKQSMLDETRHKVDLFSAAEREKTGQQMRNIRRVLRSIYDLREKKILDIAVNKSRTGSKIIDVGNMLDVEKQLFESLVSEMNFFRQGLLNNVLEMRAPSMLFESEDALHDHSRRSSPAPSLPPGQALVVMSRGVAQFLGPELEVYGPFQAGEAAVLPAGIASILVSQGSAVGKSEAPLLPQVNSVLQDDVDERPIPFGDGVDGREDSAVEMGSDPTSDAGVDLPSEMDVAPDGSFSESDLQPEMQDINPSRVEISD